MLPERLHEWGVIYVNGRVLPAEEATVCALDRGFLYGDGIFETIRVYRGVPFMLDAHLDRMRHGCSVVMMQPPDFEEIKRGVEQVLGANKLTDAYLRITVTRGATGEYWFDLGTCSPTVVIMAKAFAGAVFRDGVRMMVSSFRSDEKSPLIRIKQTGILWKILARAEARHAGFDDALFLNTNDHVSEASSANIFWVEAGYLYTPDLDCGLLPGITRSLVIDIARKEGIPVTEGMFSLDQLLGADEVFLTSSTWELAPVRSIGSVTFGEVPGRTTARLARLYRSLPPGCQSER